MKDKDHNASLTAGDTDLGGAAPREVRVGVIVRCAVCGDMKKPIGRSGPLEASYCDDDCKGYRQEPFPGSLWPGETSEQFGFPIGTDGTVLATEYPATMEHASPLRSAAKK